MNDPVENSIKKLSEGDYFILAIDNSNGLDSAKLIVTTLREIEHGRFANDFTHTIFPVEPGSRAVLLLGEIMNSQLSNSVREVVKNTISFVPGVSIFKQGSKGRKDF